MWQLNFSDQAIAELNKLDKLEQLELMEAFSAITDAEIRKAGSNELGKFTRGKITYYRLRADQFRIYFEQADAETLFAHYILHQHTLTDFVFRFKLPLTEEQVVENHGSFWKYLDTLKKPEKDADEPTSLPPPAI
ncbi:MAG: type II toxin-antitoxin system RelE/ParE family toxin [Opitutales bacterium]